MPNLFKVFTGGKLLATYTTAGWARSFAQRQVMPTSVEEEDSNGLLKVIAEFDGTAQGSGTKWCARCKKHLALDHFPCERVVRRRLPYGTVPPEIANHGFVADLISGVTQAAMGLPVTFHQKNGDWYLQIRLPDQAERDRIDADTARDSEPLSFFEMGRLSRGYVRDDAGKIIDGTAEDAYDMHVAGNELPLPDWALLADEQRSDFERGYDGKEIA